MVQTDVVIIGLNEDALEIISQLENKKILVIDDRSFAQYSKAIDFSDDKLFGIYQSSLEANQYEGADYDTMKEFYQLVVSLHSANEAEQKKELIRKLDNQGIKVIKGRTIINSSSSLTVDYLQQSSKVEFNELILNTGLSEKKEEKNPYVFTLEELLATQLLPEEMIIEVKSMKDLEIALLFSHFNTKVKALLTKNVFVEVDHLMFRDSIRESLADSSIEIVEKATISTIEEQASFGVVTYETVSDKKFPPSTETIQDHFTVFLQSFEPVINDFGLGLEKVQDVYTAAKFLEQNLPFHQQTIHLSLPYVHIKRPEITENAMVIRLNANEIHYFKRIHEVNGGIEVMIDPKTETIQSAIFYCNQSLVLRDICKMLMEYDVKLSYFNSSRFDNSSVMSIFVDIARAYRKEV